MGGWVSTCVDLAAQSVPHSKLPTPAVFWLLQYLRELSTRNRHDCLRYLPICLSGQVFNVQWASTRGVSTGVTAVHGEEGQFPEYQILMHEANPMDRRPLHYIWGPIKNQRQSTGSFFLFRREIVPHAHRMPIRVTIC